MNSREEKNKEIHDEIEKEERREKSLKVIKISLKIFTILMIIFISSYYYITEIATNSLIVKEKRIVDSTLPSSFNGLKIIQVSDILYDQNTSMDNIKKLVDEINIRKPDLVLFTGDLIKEDYSLSNKKQEKLISLLESISPTIGKYAVNGDNDTEVFSTIMNQADFTILNNKSDFLYDDDNNPILLVGLSSLNTDERKVDESFKYFREETANKEIFTIVMMHETDSIDYILENYKGNIIFGGNSLNGTIRVSSGLIKVEGNDTYSEPYYKVNNSNIFVSSGIGTLSIPFRINNRPSINFIRLSSE